MVAGVQDDSQQQTVDAVVRRLIELREKAGVSQSQLARLTGLSRSGIRHLEAGETNPTLYTVLKISSALGISGGRLIQVAAKNPLSSNRPSLI